MKVAVVHNLTAGGAHRRLSEQVAALDAEVVEVTTTLAEPVTARPYLVPLDLRASRLPAAVRPPMRHLDLRRLAAAWLRIGSLARRTGADVVYANPDSVLRGAMPCGPQDAPLLRYCDEPRRVDYEPQVQSELRRSTRVVYARLRSQERRLDRRALADADAVATNSRYTASRIHAAYNRAAAVIPCGVPRCMTPAQAETPAAGHHLLSVGALILSKGHDLVIRAAALSRNRLPLVIVAHRSSDEAQRLHTLAQECGVRLEIRIGVTDQELVHLYRHAHATLYLAAAEPLGLVSLEAQACGSPVLVADEGGLPETLRNGVTGFAVPRDPAAVAAALQRLDDPTRRARMSQAAAQHGTAASWAECTDVLYESLAALAASHAERGAVSA